MWVVFQFNRIFLLYVSWSQCHLQTVLLTLGVVARSATYNNYNIIERTNCSLVNINYCNPCCKPELFQLHLKRFVLKVWVYEVCYASRNCQTKILSPHTWSKVFSTWSRIALSLISSTTLRDWSSVPDPFLGTGVSAVCWNLLCTPPTRSWRSPKSCSPKAVNQLVDNSVWIRDTARLWIITTSVFFYKWGK